MNKDKVVNTKVATKIAKVQPIKDWGRKQPKQIATRVNSTAREGEGGVLFQGAKDYPRIKINQTHHGKPWLEDVLKLNNMDFTPSQTDWKKALKIFKDNLGVLNKDNYNEQLDEITSDNEREDFKQEQRCLRNEAKLYACLHNVHKVTGIAWVPVKSVQTKPLQFSDTSLKGHYVVKYLDENDEEQTVDVSSVWVQNNFNSTLLSYAQQAAYKSLERTEVRNENGTISKKFGFVDCKSEGITIVIENTTYHKIWYVPANKSMSGDLYVKDSEGNFKLKNGERIKNDERKQVTHPVKW